MKSLPAILLLITGASFTCTTIIVTPGATQDGSMYVTHSDDNDLEDERMIFIPAMHYDPGMERNVYCASNVMGEFPEYNCFIYPRLVCTDRGPGYDTEGYPLSIPLGTIPQVEQTFSYFDGIYGIMNERQLMIGECTCDSKIQLPPEPGRRIFYSAELSRVALERCSTAVDAVLLIGSLIDDYGYWGTGETLLLGDPHEAWVMEMCSGTLDWLTAVSNGEFRHPYYSLRRVWRVLSRVAPSLVTVPLGRGWLHEGLSLLGGTGYPPVNKRCNGAPQGSL